MGSKFIWMLKYIDKRIKIWNIDAIECLKVLEGHSDTVYNLELTSEGNFLSCSSDQTVKLWQIETDKLLKSINFNESVICVKMLTGNLMAIGLENGEIEIYNISKEETVKTISAHSSYLFQVKYLSNGNLLSGDGKGEIMLWKIFE